MQEATDMSEQHMRPMYSYVGPQELRQLLHQPAYRVHVQQPSDVLTWIADTFQRLDADRTITTTFIVAADGGLWIADRHSEHVVCARGEAVRSAGEMTFEVQKQQVAVVGLTNQSTGYCPEPEVVAVRGYGTGSDFAHAS